MCIERIDRIEDLASAVLRERLGEGKRAGTEEFVALLEGHEAGLLIFEHFARHSMGQVHEIYVLDVFRGDGIGQHLLSHAESLARQHGYLELRLMARSLDPGRMSDDDLSAWYRKNGFRLDSADSMWMQKELGPSHK